MTTILDAIIFQKQLEIKRLYEQYDLDDLKKEAATKNISSPAFYQYIAAARAAQKPFFITEFKRKSPSEGWINREADLPAQVRVYAQAGAGAISVLTDTAFFGGSYADLNLAFDTLEQGTGNRPLLLQKDFVLDPIQVYLAKQHGADIILLIAAILSPERLDGLRRLAESIGLGVLVEVHDWEELVQIQHLDFPVLGVNNRDLKTFRTALNRVNALAPTSGGRFLIAESGIKDYRDFQIVKKADGFLIGTGLMQKNALTLDLASMFRIPEGRHFLFKACGIRAREHIRAGFADWIGINFSPLSKRRYDLSSPLPDPLPAGAVAVFYRNTEAEILEILARYPFKIIQLYSDDVSPEFVRSLKQKVLLACAVRNPDDLERLHVFASDIDLFILDGAQPGSGQGTSTKIPSDFPYPFLLAGGMTVDNLERIQQYENCIGVDIASGIERDGMVDVGKVEALRERLGLMAIRP